MILGPFCSTELDLAYFSIIVNLAQATDLISSLAFPIKDPYTQYLSFDTLLRFVVYVGAM